MTSTLQLQPSAAVVSIILPTYNRARFLPEAIGSIRRQKWTDWELIIVDDGSTDGTAELLPELTRGVEQSIRLVRQSNQGAYAARNTGLDHATGKYVAFYDSDDLWLPHHLDVCVKALEDNAEVDWVYGASRIVDLAGKVIAENSFYVDGTARPFMALRQRRAGEVHIIEDQAATACQILHGFYCGLQNSVLRRQIFDEYRFAAECRNEAEDQIIVIESLLQGRRFAYIDQVHVDYRLHGENSSAAGDSCDWHRRAIVLTKIAEGFEHMLARPGLPRQVRRALRRRLGDEYFWILGYATFWKMGDKWRAVSALRRGLAYWPWAWRRWITFVGCIVRTCSAQVADDSEPNTGSPVI